MSRRRDPQRPVLRPAEWPEGDRAAWDTAFRTGDVFDETGRAAHWRPKTRALVATNYGRWLGWLRMVGELNDAEAPADRTTPDRSRRYIADLQKVCRDSTVVMQIEGLARAHWAMAPGDSLKRLRQVISHLRLNARTRKDKRPRIRSSRELLELGFALMEEADTFSPVPWKRAARYRDGLIIALLAARPLRLSNFADLELGRTLILTDTAAVIAIPAQESKSGQPIELPLPDALVSNLRIYLEVCRPDLLGENDDPHLWITKYGKPMRSAAINVRVCKLTEKAFGESVNPHLFRDCLATSVAIDDPEHVRIASVLLGHSTLETTTKNYNQATSLTAGRSVNATIQTLRRRSIRSARDRGGS